MKRYILSIGAALLCTAMSAQQTDGSKKIWTLGDCIEYALEQNIALKQQELTVENQRLAHKATQMSRLPGINGQIGETYNIGRGQNREGVVEDRANLTTSVGVNASLNIFQGMRIHNQAKADKLSFEAATLDLAQAREDLSLQVTANYLQVLYTKEEETVAAKKVKICEDLLERTKVLVDMGKSSQSELYDAESSLAAAKSASVDAVNNREVAVLNLLQQMNYNVEEEFDIELPSSEILMDNAILSLSPVDSVYDDYIVRRPSIIAADKRLQQARRNIKVMQSGWYPSLNFGASYNTGYYATQSMASGTSSFWQQLSANGTPTVGLSLNIPIFDRLSTHYNVRRAKNELRNQELSLLKQKQDVYKEVQQAYVNAKAAYGKYLAALRSVDAATKAFEFEQKKFDAGRSTAYQYNEMNIKLSNETSSLSQAKYSFILRTKILNFYKGEALY